MKKLLLLLAIVLLSSCGNTKVEDLASYEINGAWYWTAQLKEGGTKQDAIDYANKWANPNQTSYFYIFNDSLDLSLFKEKRFSPREYKETILLNKPIYGFYKMRPADTTLYDDGIWLLEESLKE